MFSFHLFTFFVNETTCKDFVPSFSGFFWMELKDDTDTNLEDLKLEKECQNMLEITLNGILFSIANSKSMKICLLMSKFPH